MRSQFRGKRVLRRASIGKLMAFTVLLIGTGRPRAAAQPAEFTPGSGRLQAAVAIEAEFFTVERDWQVIVNGQGNYMVDIIGFQHIGGERLLGIDEANHTASAYHDVIIPEDGDYRLLVRYEYPPFTECRFQVAVTQGRQTMAQMVMGRKDNPRFAFNDRAYRPQYDPAWGAEGLVLEALNIRGLKAGPARLHLRAAEQPQIPGVSARRHIDFIYLTRDMNDSWWGRQSSGLYPILDVFRQTVGSRWEVRVLNRGDQPLTLGARFQINREPWETNEGNLAVRLAAGEWSSWHGLRMHDTTHFHNGTFRGNQPFDLEIRPVGGGDVRGVSSEENGVRLYIPPYPRWDEAPITPEERIDQVLALLDERPAPGREPTLPLTYGGWLPVGTESAYQRKYGELYKAIGMRAFPSTGASPDTMRAIGLEPNRTYMVARNIHYPSADNIAKALDAIQRSGHEAYMKWYDYGDEIHFDAWVELALKESEDDVSTQWQRWLNRNRAGYKPADYWLSAWGNFVGDANPAMMLPDSSDAAARENPRLFVDSMLFYRDMAIAAGARGLQRVKAAFGQEVMGGVNYSAHPFYYPLTSMYVHWFRGAAADVGRHSDYFWQVTQPGPMINGYLAEHFRAGMRDNPRAVNRQYTMPHAPGNTDASFRRTAFTHLAHGAKMLDYFGIGMNECFTENHIDHRDHDRYVAIRDINYCIATVEDLMLASEGVRSRVALLLSDSTEIWDMAPLTRDRAKLMLFEDGFREARLIYHLERLGLWKALTFAGESPDLIVEEDLTADLLKDYNVLYVVGDCLPPAAADEVGRWVEAGGVLVATATAGGFDPYRAPSAAWSELLGIRNRETDLRDAFARPRQELPFLEPYDRIIVAADTASENAATMPSLAVVERFEPVDGSDVMATFASDGKPAAIRRAMRRGHVLYIGAFPGVAYLWTALQPPQVPDRGGLTTHVVPTGFDPVAGYLIGLGLDAADVRPRLDTGGRLIDARLIRSGNSFFVPLADYDRDTGQPLTLTVDIDRRVRTVASAYHGQREFKQEGGRRGGRLTVTLPSVQYGDILRFNP